MRGGGVRFDSSVVGESRSHRAGPLSSSSMQTSGLESSLASDLVTQFVGLFVQPICWQLGYDVADGDGSDDRRWPRRRRMSTADCN